MPDILILIDILKLTNPMRQIIQDLAGEHTAISTDKPAFPIFGALLEFPQVYFASKFVLIIAISMLGSSIPLALVVLFRGVEHTAAMLQVLVPVPRVVGRAIVVVVRAEALFLIHGQHAVVDLPTRKKIGALPMEAVLTPATKVDIAGGVGENPLALPPVRRALPDVQPTIWVLHLEMVLQAADATDVFLFLSAVRLRYLPDLPVLLTGHATRIYTML